MDICVEYMILPTILGEWKSSRLYKMYDIISHRSMVDSILSPLSFSYVYVCVYGIHMCAHIYVYVHTYHINIEVLKYFQSIGFTNDVRMDRLSIFLFHLFICA
jgi:hypothetical protein